MERRITAATVGSTVSAAGEIVVLSAAGISQGQIASRVGISRVTVNHWCQQFLTEPLAGLEYARARPVACDRQVWAS